MADSKYRPLEHPRRKNMVNKTWVIRVVLFLSLVRGDWGGGKVEASTTIVITEVVYDGVTESYEGDEFVELYNMTDSPIDILGYKIGDEEMNGGREGMYVFPSGTSIEAGSYLLVAKNAYQFNSVFGIMPDFEMVFRGLDM